MPVGKVIRCRTCGKVILRYKKPRYSKEEILSAIRRHYKKHHPRRFKQFIKKALRTKRKRGIINKHNPKVKLTSRLKRMLMKDYWFYRKKGFSKSRAMRKAWFGIRKRL